MTMILGQAEVKSSFISRWTDYCTAILEYANGSRKKAIRDLMKDEVYDEEGKLQK